MLECIVSKTKRYLFDNHKLISINEWRLNNDWWKSIDDLTDYLDHVKVQESHRIASLLGIQEPYFEAYSSQYLILRKFGSKKPDF